MTTVSRILLILLLLPPAMAAWGKTAQTAAVALTPSQAKALVERALSGELRTVRDQNHPMRYLLRKASPRLTTTKEILETRDGDVARLVAVFDRPLNDAEEAREQARLDGLLDDPERQRHRKQSEEGDLGIVLKLLRMLPKAYIYQYAGSGSGPGGTVEKFNFRPDPNFSPPDLESQALTAMTGEIWIDAAHERVARLEGHLQQDTNYGWGVLGKLNKGGSIVIEQGEVADQQWRIARFKMQMELRILFKTRNIDTTEEMTRYEVVPPGINYREAIRLLRAGPGGTAHGGR
jgi:hypothetical protein